MGCNCGKNKGAQNSKKIVKSPRIKNSQIKGGTNIRKIIRRSAY